MPTKLELQAQVEAQNAQIESLQNELTEVAMKLADADEAASEIDILDEMYAFSVTQFRSLAVMIERMAELTAKVDNLITVALDASESEVKEILGAVSVALDHFMIGYTLGEFAQSTTMSFLEGNAVNHLLSLVGYPQPKAEGEEKTEE